MESVELEAIFEEACFSGGINGSGKWITVWDKLHLDSAGCQLFQSEGVIPSCE